MNDLSYSLLSGQGPGLVNVLSLLSGYSRNLHITIFKLPHTFSHTHATLPNASTSSQSHAHTRAARQSHVHKQSHVQALTYTPRTTEGSRATL